MSTFAIYYNYEDAIKLAGLLQAQNSFTSGERQVAQRLWNAGLNQWDDPANIIPADDPNAAGDPNVRRIVISSPQVTLASLVNLCRAIGNRVPGAEFLDAIASDLATTGKEPYP